MPPSDTDRVTDPGVLAELIDLAGLITSRVTTPQHLLERAADAARDLLGADVVAVSRIDMAGRPDQLEAVPTPPEGRPTGPPPDTDSLPLGIPSFDPASGETALRTLVNVGVLGPEEQHWPRAEYYAVADYPEHLGYLRGGPPRIIITDVANPAADPAEVALLHRTGRTSSLSAPMLVDGRLWGELWAARGPSVRPFTRDDAPLAELVAGLLAAGLVQADAWQRLQRMAWSDPLTGVANRRAFDERLATLLADPASTGSLSVAVADVNGLKEINDRDGHAAGDEVLRMVAEKAAFVVRDVPGALAARIGGDEFALLLPGLGARRAYRRAATWCLLVANESRGVSLACGVSSHAESRNDGDRQDVVQLRTELVRAADAAAYRAKRSKSVHPLRAPSQRFGRSGIPQ